MKAQVIIENGETTIVLTPENMFDKDVLEKVYSKKEQFKLITQAEADYSYGSYQNHKFTISIKEIRP